MATTRPANEKKILFCCSFFLSSFSPHPFFVSDIIAKKELFELRRSSSSSRTQLLLLPPRVRA